MKGLNCKVSESPTGSPTPAECNEEEGPGFSNFFVRKRAFARLAVWRFSSSGRGKKGK